MNITLIGDVTGTRNGENWPPRGTTVDLPDEEARSLIGAGLAVEAERGAELHPFGAGAPGVAELADEAARAAGPVESAAQDTRPASRKA